MSIQIANRITARRNEKIMITLLPMTIAAMLIIQSIAM